MRLSDVTGKQMVTQQGGVVGILLIGSGEQPVHILGSLTWLPLTTGWESLLTPMGDGGWQKIWESSL